MFLCISLNPAIDKRLKLKQLQLGKVNRAVESLPAPGGKAAHVAMVLRTLGGDPLWLGFVGGGTGTELVQGLGRLSIRVKAIPTGNPTRTNLEIVDEAGVTEILEPGQEVTESEVRNLRNTMKTILDEAGEPARVILSGSLPRGVCRGFYAELVTLACESGGKVFLDTSGEPLKLALAAGPGFIKPNQEEAEIWKGSAISDVGAAQTALDAMLKAGASAGALSLGARGLLFKAARQGGDTFLAKGPQLVTRSCVGSGDAALAGFAFADEQKFSAEESVRLAAACGAANCLADGPGLARAEDITRMKEQIQVEKLT